MSTDATPAEAEASPAPKPAKAKKPKAPAIDFRLAADRLAIAGQTERLRILFILAEGEHCGADLMSIAGLAQPAVSSHLAILRQTGMVESERRGQKVFNLIAPYGQRIVDFVRASQL
jgi:DNA-binding transcriptional ArsR family regulator